MRAHAFPRQRENPQPSPFAKNCDNARDGWCATARGARSRTIFARSPGKPHIKGLSRTIELLDGGRRFLDVGVLDDAVAAGAALAAGGMSTREMEPHWEKMPRSSSTEVDHGMLPTYRRLEGSSDAIVTVVCFVLAKVRHKPRHDPRHDRNRLSRKVASKQLVTKSLTICAYDSFSEILFSRSFANKSRTESKLFFSLLYTSHTSKPAFDHFTKVRKKTKNR